MGNLTDQMEALAQGILTSTRERGSAISDIKAHTSSLLSAFERQRAAAVEAWKTAVSADGRARAVQSRMQAAEVKKMRQGFRRDHDRMERDLRQKLTQSTKGVASSVASLRVGFTKAHHRMAKEQRAGFAADRRTRFHAVTKFMEETRDRLGRFREDIQGAHQVWKNLLFAQTGVAAPETIPGFRGKHEEIRRAKEHAQAEATRRRKAEEEQRAKEARAEKSDDGEKVLHIIQARPDGISISRIAEMMGRPGALVTRLVTELVEKVKVRKNGASRLYFPVS